MKRRIISIPAAIEWIFSVSGAIFSQASITDAAMAVHMTAAVDQADGAQVYLARKDCDRHPRSDPSVHFLVSHLQSSHC